LTESSPGRIFISYRGQDTAWPAGRLYDFLVAHSAAVGSSDVLRALICPQRLTMTDENGQSRLDDPEDCVQPEIETANGHAAPRSCRCDLGLAHRGLSNSQPRRAQGHD
jgi:hypothetical protein